MPQEDYDQLEGQHSGETQAEPEQSTGQQGHQDAAGQRGEQKLVPLEVVQSIREESKEAKERARQLEQYIQQMQQQGNQQQQQSNDPFGDSDDDEFLTVGQARKIMQQQEQQSQQVMREMQMRQTVPDYDDVVQNYLPELIKEKPHLRDAILSSGDPYSLAYELGSSFKQAKQQKPAADTQQQQSEQPAQEGQSELEKTLDKNQQKPGSVSQVGTGAQGGMDDAAVYQHMPVSDLDEEIAKVKRGS